MDFLLFQPRTKAKVSLENNYSSDVTTIKMSTGADSLRKV